MIDTHDALVSYINLSAYRFSMSGRPPHPRNVSDTTKSQYGEQRVYDSSYCGRLYVPSVTVVPILAECIPNHVSQLLRYRANTIREYVRFRSKVFHFLPLVACDIDGRVRGGERLGDTRSIFRRAVDDAREVSETVTDTLCSDVPLLGVLEGTDEPDCVLTQGGGRIC